jgi:hypothetical protein
VDVAGVIIVAERGNNDAHNLGHTTGTRILCRACLYIISWWVPFVGYCSNMVGMKGVKFSHRRKSFDERFQKPKVDVPLTGTVGKNLGFWMTAFLGFQTLGAIYGIPITSF